MAAIKFLVDIDTDGDAIASGVTLTGQSDWNATSGGSEILNKPTAVAELTNHYLKVSLPSAYLSGGGSALDFDVNGDNLVSGLSQDDIAGTFISFADDKFTVSEDGMYTFNISAEYTSSVTQRVTPAVYFKVNGTLVDGKSLAYIRQVGAVDEGTTNLSRTLMLTAADEVEVFYSNQGQINTGSTAPALMFMVEAYSNTMTVTGVAGGGDTNVQSDWNATSGDALILNKPTLPPSTAEENVQSDWNSASGDEFIKNKPTTISGTQAANIVTNNGKNTYPSADATKLSGIATGAEVNVQSDWNATTGDSFIQNKPTLAPSNAEQNVQSDWNATTGDALILNKPDTLHKYSPVSYVSSSRDMAVGDRDAFLINDNAIILTFQNDSTWNVPVGSSGRMTRIEDDGQFYIEVGTGVTFNGFLTAGGKFAINGASSENTATLEWVKIAANQYWITGDVAEA